MEEEVRYLLANNQKINAIKLVRERAGVGLKEAKDYVQALEDGLSPPDLQGISYDPMSGDLRAEVQYLLAQGKKIDAVKLVRERTAMDLKKAKNYVDSVDPNFR